MTALKVWTIHWRATSEDLDSIAFDTVKVIGTEDNTPDKAMAFLELAYTRKKWHFSYDVTEVREATSVEVEVQEAKARQDRLDRLMSN